MTICSDCYCWIVLDLNDFHPTVAFSKLNDQILNIAPCFKAKGQNKIGGMKHTI